MAYIITPTRLDDFHCFDDRRLKAAFMTDGERDLVVVDGLDGAQYVGAGHRQWFFAEHMFAGVGGGDDLVGVLSVRRAQHHGLDRRIFQHGVEVGDDVHAMLLGEIGDGSRVDFNNRVDGDFLAGLEQRDNDLAPPAHTDDCDIQHCVLLVAVTC